MARLSEKELLWKKINKRFSKGMVDYQLIEEGDKVLVGLSGGKDSLALLELLAHRSRVFKPRFSVIAVYVGMTNIAYQTDVEYLKRFASELGVPFIAHETSFDASTDQRKSPCFLCSWNRRKALFTVAKQEGCTKIALGHHMDDILETLLMNMTFQGTVSTMPPLLKMNKFDMSIIRPMCLVHEADLKEWSVLSEYKQQVKLCPYEKESHRSDIKNVLHSLEKLNPEARYSLWGSMSNIQPEFLPTKKTKQTTCL